MSRKAAYRALTEMSEYMEGQRRQAEEAAQALRTAQRTLWTPTSVWEKCCPPWIAYGVEVPRVARCQAGSGSIAIKGCNGACGKDHPRIVVTWVKQHAKDKVGTAVATLSHALDPFVHYMQGLCQQGLATQDKDNPLCYKLSGYLPEFLERNESQLIV